jgi:type I restriction enzyme S subunit
MRGKKWRELTWGDLATLEYGKRLSDYEDSDGIYPVYGTNGQIGYHTEALCKHAGIIIGRKGAYRGVEYSDVPFYVIDTAFYLEPKVEIDMKWAYYELSTHDINSMDSGSAIPSTSRDDFYRLKVDVPPLPTQRRIAEILGALDDKIELNRQMNDTLEAMAQTLYRHWFVDFGPFQDQPFVDSDLGPIPEGWEVKPLDEIASFLNGTAWGRYEPDDDDEPTTRVIKIRELRGGFDEKSDRVSKNKLPEKYFIRDEDVIFSWSGSLVLKIWTHGLGALNQHLFKVSSDQYPKWFFYYALQRYVEHFRRIAESKATTMGHIKRSHLSGALVAVPPQAVLNQAGKLISPLFERRLANFMESRLLSETRDYLLPKLVSGEIEVDAAEETVDAAA